MTTEERPRITVAAVEPDDLFRGNPEPSVRTLRLREMDGLAEDVIEAVNTKGAAMLNFAGTDWTGPQFVTGLRSAIARTGAKDIRVEKKRNQDVAYAWKMRPIDQERLARRIETGRRLGALVARRRAATKNRTTTTRGGRSRARGT